MTDGKRGETERGGKKWETGIKRRSRNKEGEGESGEVGREEGERVRG